MKFVVDESKWLRGQMNPKGEHAYTYLCNEKGEMCCLGFAANQLGISKDDLCNTENPFEITEVANSLNIVGILTDARGIKNSEFAGGAIDINDDELITDTQRKRQLRELAKKYGHQFIFRKSVEAA